MTKSITAVLACAIFFTQLAQAAPIQTTTTQQSAPIERSTPTTNPSSPEGFAQARLLSAHTIYIVSDGADDAFPISPSYALDLFTDSMHTWGRYTLVSNIADADIVLQLRSAVSTNVIDGTDTQNSSVSYNPYFRLTIADPVTLQPLWVITIPVQTGTRKKNDVDLFIQSTQNLTSQLKLLVDEPLSTQESTALRQSQRRSGHGFLPLGIGLGVFATVAIGGAVAFIHFKNQSEKDQHNFCVENHFPSCP